MKFYKRFPGDIQIKTGHLTPAEFGCYDRLLDHYYATEAAIPEGRAYSICRAITKADRGAVDRVLTEFFRATGDGWVQQRAEEMIAEAQPKIEAAKANGKKGGRPKRKPTGFSDETDSVAGDKASQSQNQNGSDPYGSAAAAAPASVDNPGSPPSDPPPPAPPPPDPPVSEKRRAWNTCGQWMVANGVGETAARELMGVLLKTYPAAAMEAMVLAPTQQAETPDPKAYLMATAKRLAGERATVPSNEAARTAEMLRTTMAPLTEEERAASEAARQRVMAGRLKESVE